MNDTKKPVDCKDIKSELKDKIKYPDAVKSPMTELKDMKDVVNDALSQEEDKNLNK